MPVCANASMTGKDYVLEMFIGCGDTRPASGDYIPIGGFTSKEVTTEWDTLDPTSDLSVGNIKETAASYLNFSISGDLVARTTDEVGRVNQILLVKHVILGTETGGKPYAWLRLTGPDLTYEGFFVITNISLSAPTTDIVTRSFEAALAYSPFGLIVTDTPVVP
jgi:predicted secreted protein